MKKIKGSVVLLVLCVLMLIFAGCSSNGSVSVDSGSAQSSGDGGAQTSDVQTEGTSVDYPTRPIEIVVGGAPGGGSDTFARTVGRELSDILGVAINIINMPGAGGGVASQELANRPADGYSIMPTVSDFQINIALGKTPNYLEQFSALARFHEDTYAIQVKGGSELADIDTFIQKAKENPGKLTIVGTGSKGLDELTVRKFEKMAGIKLNYVPYEDAGMLHSAVLGGHADAMIEEVGYTAELVKQGKLDLAVVLASERLADFPDVPTTVEKGWDITNGMNRGFVVHKDTPQEIKKILEEALEKAYRTERYTQFAKENYLHIKNAWLDSKAYQELLEREVEEYKQILAELE
mgnify:CR=1 FL=1